MRRTQKAVEKRALPVSVGSQKGDDIAFPDGEIDAFKYFLALGFGREAFDAEFFHVAS